jgi:hypothetical protein
MRYRLRILFQNVPAFIADEREFGIRPRGFRRRHSPAIQTINRYYRWDGVPRRKIEGAASQLVHFYRYLDLKNCFPALYTVAVSQMGSVDPYAVYIGSVGGTEVAQKGLRRGYLENTVMAREKTVVRQAKLGILAPPDHKCVVLVECKDAPGLRPRRHP